MKYQEWLEDWLTNYVRPTAKHRTYIRYCEIVKQHITPKIGMYELNELTPYRLQSFVTSLTLCGNLKTGKGLSSNSVNVMINVVKNSLKTTYTLGYIKEYTADKIKRPKKSEKKVECLNLYHQKIIEKQVIGGDKPKLFGIVLCLYTGLRLGELLALEWSDVDFSKGQLTVNKTCHDGIDERGVFGRITSSPKTPSSVRIIPLPDKILSLLNGVKQKSHSKYVVSNGDKMMSLRSYQRTFSCLLKKLGIPHYGFHSLRHTFATRALECGMDVKTLSEILGHKNPTVTLNRYVHSMMDHKRNMMDLVGKLL